MATEVVEKKGGPWPKGVSGNPLGRPKGSKNQISALKQAMELQLRELAAGDMMEVMEKCISMAKNGDKQMIRLLLEYHLSKSSDDDKDRGVEKVEIKIGRFDNDNEKPVIDITPKEEE